MIEFFTENFLGGIFLPEERLQKIISRAGLMSRREAEKFILDGKVSVDGKIISELGKKFDAEKNKICVDGKTLNFDAEKIYILLNKPRGGRKNFEFRREKNLHHFEQAEKFSFHNKR